MRRLDDHRFAKRLLEVLDEDRRRLGHDPDWASVVVWIAEEVRTQSERLQIPGDFAALMRSHAEAALREVRHKRDERAA
ncbi:MAG: hypothetical protein VYC34_03360 [Planctomycetota bacterium]|nr:hypothetical protein [Planctomycetota bacterium]